MVVVWLPMAVILTVSAEAGIVTVGRLLRRGHRRPLRGGGVVLPVIVIVRRLGLPGRRRSGGASRVMDAILIATMTGWGANRGVLA